MRPLDREVLDRLRPGRRQLAVAAVATVVQSLLIVAQAFAVSAVIVALTRGDDPTGGLWATGVVFALRAAAGWVADVSSAKAAAAVGATLRRQVVDAALAQSPTSAAARPTGAVVALATRGVAAVEPYLTRYLPALVLATVLPLLTLIAFATQDLLSALIVLLTLPLVPLFAVLVGLTTRERAQRQWRELSMLAGHFVDVVKGLPTLVAFRRADAQVTAIRQISHRHRRASLGTLRIAFASSAVLELVATISVALVAVSVGLRLAAGGLDLDTALVVLLLAPEAYWPLRRVGAEFHAAAEGTATFAEVSALLRGAREPVGRPTDIGCPDLRTATLRLHEATVCHPGRRVPALSALSATISPGGLVAIAGPSGAGKSTLLEVLLGRRPLASGSVEVAGRSLAELDLEAWLAQISWVPQRPWFLPGSVADNLRLAAPLATEPAMWEALRRVELAEVVAALPGGLASPVGEDGRGLSAGERARLALARAVLAERPLVLLDEPTAHLDADTERIVLGTLGWLSRRSTVVVVAHRQAVLDIADRVIRLTGPVHHSEASVAAAEPARSLRGPTQETHETRETVDRPSVSARQEQTGGSRMWWGAALAACASASGVALTATAGWLIVRASQQPPVLMLLVAIIAVRAFGIARPALRYVERLVSHDAALRGLAERRAEVFAALIPLTPGALGRRRGDVLASVVDDVDAFVDRQVRVVVPMVAAIAVGLGAVLYAASVSLSAATMVALLALGGGGGSWWMSRRAVRRAENSFVTARAQLSTAVADTIEGAPELGAWGARVPALDRISAIGDRLAATAVRSARGVASGRALLLLVLGAALVAMGAVLRQPVVDGSLSAPVMALLVLLPLGLLEVLATLPDAASAAVRTASSLSRIDALLRARPLVASPEWPRVVARADGGLDRGTERAGAEVALHDVAAGWGEDLVFERVSLRLAAGESMGVVGASGSGKSTLAAVLLRFLDPHTGQVTLDGVDLRALRLEDVRASVGLVDDDPHVFSSNVLENVRLARPQASESDVAQAIRDARLSDWLDDLPGGLQTRVGDSGADISGGERARLALARSLLADQPVLVLDEPTAHLDSSTAAAVAADLLAAASDRSVVFISHRVEGLELVDRVLDLDTYAAASRRPSSPVAASRISETPPGRKGPGGAVEKSSRVDQRP